MIIACNLLLGACGGSGSPPEPNFDDDDAGPELYCWPELYPIVRGSVELGVGETEFSALPETVPMFFGLQGGFGVMVRTRMTGFDPGDAMISDASKPFTRVRATFVDRVEPLTYPSDCGYRNYYEPNSVGGYDVHDSLIVAFNTCWGTDTLVGAKLQLEVELMDASGSYAKDTRIITAAETVDPAYHDVPTSPNCGE